MEKIAFIDLEACGLGPASWPIEVGWCFENGEAEAVLIKPDAAWSLDIWDKTAEALHGLSIDEVTRNGAPAEDVCIRLNKTLAGFSVYSDAPDWDGFWLYRLFEAAGIKQQFALADFSDVFVEMAEEKKLAILEEASKLAPHRHRAGADVLHMKEVYALTRIDES